MRIARNYVPIIITFVCLSISSCVTQAPTVKNDKQSPTPVKTINSYVPLGQESDEANFTQLELARDQGKATEAALTYLLQNSFGEEMTAGPYHIAFCIEKPKGYYQQVNGKSTWVSPSGNAFISVIVRDGFDGRIIPDLNIKLTMESRLVDIFKSKQLPYGWFPLVNRYGDNVELPQRDEYSLKIEIDIPKFKREDYINGDRYPEIVKADFNHFSFQINELKDPVRSDNQNAWLALAVAQGRAEQDALETMMGKVATDGKEEQNGDYLVAYTYDYAAGYWELKAGKLKYNNRIIQSTEKNGNIGIIVMDKMTGRFLPNLTISARFLYDLNPIVKVNPELVWHPWLYHYAQNIRIPGGKSYTLQVHADPPAFRRYDKNIGEIMNKPIDISFSDIKVKSGQK
ncbi:MAG TPA: hypothetical protein VKA27_02260 [Sunxiuqinia sp.]|nr:hypothetical protein [Sunxiuqinia sp.]